LCLAGAGALLLLIFARGLSQHSSHRRQNARRQLIPILLDGRTDVERARGVEAQVATRLTIELAELMRGSDRARMLAAADALGVPELLKKQTCSRSAQDRLFALETLALFANYTDVVERALEDRSPDIRLGAALALASREDGPNPIDIVRKLRIGEVENSLLLVSLMSDLAERDPVAVHAMLFEDSVPEPAKVAIIDALADRGHTHAPLLASIAKEGASDPELRPRILRALGRTAHPSGAAAIEAGLASEDWRVRTAAAEAAGRTALSQLAGKLGMLLSDGQWWVRFRSGEALLRLGKPGLGVLQRAAEGPEGHARKAAIALLAERAAA